MKIKHFVGLIGMTLIACLGLTFTSCSSSSDDPEPTISVNGSPIIEADGTVIGDINVMAENTDWTVDVSYGREWLIAYKNGSKVELSAKENTSTEMRNATVVVTATASSTMSYTVNITQKGAQTTIKVSPSVELLGAENSTTTITVSASQNTTWNITGVPDWLSLNKSGLGSSTVTITATSDNFSDEVREAVLTFTTENGAASATCKVEQKGVLATNCRVTIGDVTVMNDGFAGDLTFDSGCKGYREGFFLASALPSLTDKDVFNVLMKEKEFSGKLDFFASPYISPTENPEVEIVYCVAAYGSENNSDGTHKYGPVTMKKIKTKARTLNSDMLLSLSYTSSKWNVTTYRQGQYGQRCDYYYYLAYEGSVAQNMFKEWNSLTDAFFAHFYFKPNIEKNEDWQMKNGPQTMSFNRNEDKFFCITWGKHNVTNEFSAELKACWYPTNLLSATKDKKLNIGKNGSIAFNRKYSLVSQMPKMTVYTEKR